MGADVERSQLKNGSLYTGIEGKMENLKGEKI